MRNSDASKLLLGLAAELAETTEKWAGKPDDIQAVAAANAMRRIAEAVGEAVRLRPAENEVSSVTATNIHTIAIQIEKSAEAASDPALSLSLRSIAGKLRRSGKLDVRP